MSPCRFDPLEGSERVSLRQLIHISTGTPAGAPPASEAALIADVLLGDRKAIADFVLQYSDIIYSFLLRRIDSPSVVEDLCQDVFLIAWSQLASFRGDSSLRTWLCAIAKNKAVDFYRKQIRELPIDDSFDEQISTAGDASLLGVEQHLDRRFQEEKIRATMLSLRPGYRAALRWRYWDEESLQSIATKTGKTVKSIERLLARARTDFATQWKVGQR